MGRSLREPVVIAEAGGVTLLTGRNVDLAPEPVAAAAGRLPGAGRVPAGALGFIAFARGRSGLVGCRGTVMPRPCGPVLRDLEAFGASSALEPFGRDLAALVAKPGRFEGLPRVAVPECPGGGARLLAEGLVAGGLGRDGGPGLPVDGPVACG